MHVLHLVNGEHYAGAERVQDLLAQWLPRFGVEVTLVWLKPDKVSRRRGCQQTPRVELPMRTRWDLRVVRPLVRLVRQRKIDLLHSHTPRTALVAALLKRKTALPWVHHVHGHTATEARRRGWAALVGWIERQVVRRANRLVAVSQTAAGYFRNQGFAPESLVVIPNGIAGPEQLPGRDAPRPPWQLGLVGLWRPRKGLEVALEALALLRTRFSAAAVLHVVGPFETPDYEQEVRRLVERLELQEQVRFLGYRQDVAAQLEQMDLLLFPSILPEGMPMVLLEAMAWGVPVVASEVPGVVDVMVPEETGVLVPPQQPETLARAALEVLNRPGRWEELRRAAFTRQRRLFSAEKMAQEVASLYQAVLGWPGAEGSSSGVAIPEESPLPCGLPVPPSVGHSPS